MLTVVIVCHCNGVSDREVRGAIERGAHATESVLRACGAGSDCGSCHAVVEQILVDTIVDAPRRRVLAHVTS